MMPQILRGLMPKWRMPSACVKWSEGLFTGVTLIGLIAYVELMHRSTQVQNQNWGRNHDQKKPWFCKQFQLGSCPYNKEHEAFGKTHKHICSHCLSSGKILNHAAKDCFVLKISRAKNGQAAVQT